MTAGILLQIQWQGFSGGGGGGNVSSSTTYIVIGAVIGVIVLIAVVMNVVRKKGGGGKGKKFRKSSFKREGRKAGLSDPQINILINLIKQQEVKTPYKLLQNGGLLDSTLHREMADVEDSDLGDEIKEARKYALFSIKQAIERNAKGKSPVTNTKGLRHGQTIVLVIEGRRYKTVIQKNLKDVLQVESPVAPGGKRIIVPRWSRVTAQFWKKQGEMYSFETKVAGLISEGGVPNLLLQHAKKVEISQQRRFRRIELAKPVYFGLVSIITTGSGRKQQKRAVVPNKRNALGTLIDISVGGCSVKTAFPIKKGELIRLQFEITKRNPIVAFGKVVSVHKERPGSIVMHVQFTKVTRKNLNEINAVIYEGISSRD